MAMSAFSCALQCSSLWRPAKDCYYSVMDIDMSIIGYGRRLTKAFPKQSLQMIADRGGQIAANLQKVILLSANSTFDDRPKEEKMGASTGKSGVLWRLAPFGAFGAVLPSIAALASRSDAFAFSPELNVWIGQIIYVTSAVFFCQRFFHTGTRPLLLGPPSWASAFQLLSGPHSGPRKWPFQP